jgi:hypothetical protein
VLLGRKDSSVVSPLVWPEKVLEVATFLRPEVYLAPIVLSFGNLNSLLAVNLN